MQVVSTNIHYAQVILDKGMKFYQQFFLLGSTLDSTPLSTFHLQKTQLEKKQSKLQAYQVKTCFPKSNARRFCMQEKDGPAINQYWIAFVVANILGFPKMVGFPNNNHGFSY